MTVALHFIVLTKLHLSDVENCVPIRAFMSLAPPVLSINLTGRMSTASDCHPQHLQMGEEQWVLPLPLVRFLLRVSW